ncbi:MAG: AsmA family protein [Nitrospiraceae bacterium]|nr:MAG: AsmA family protein [Nitrospiraceae bacterium]
MKRIITIIASVFALIIIGLIILIKTYVTPERVREFLVPYAEQTLNRKVSIGEVNISLFKGIAVTDFAIKETDGKADFVKCRDFVLRFQLLPLLTGKIIIDELKLLSPEVLIRRDDKGKFNFEGLGKKEKAETAPAGKETPEAKGLPVSLLINNITVKDAGFTLLDGLNKLPGIKGAFSINAKVKSADGSKLFSEGGLDLTFDEIILQKRRINNIRAALAYAVNIDLGSDHLRIDKADLKLQGMPASITGDIRRFRQGPELDLAISLTKLRASDLWKELSSFTDIKGLSLSGNISADVKLKGLSGKMDTLKAEGLVSLEKAGIKFKNINTVLDGKLKFSERSIDIDIKGTTGKNTVDIKGAVADYFKNPYIKLNLYSKQLLLDELVSVEAAKVSSIPGKAWAASVEVPGEAAPLNLKLAAEGEIKIGSAVYKGIKMNDFYAKYQFKDNKLEIPKITAVAGKGKLNINSAVDLSKPGYVYNLAGSLDSLHADEVINSLFPKAKDTVFGVLSANLRLNGRGTLPESIRKNLAGDGDFSVKDGKITNAKITENLALLLGIDELRTINLKQANGTVKIKDGVARLDSVFVSDDIAMNPSGYIGLDETLDLAFDLKLSPRLSNKTVGSGIAKYIRDEEGWGIIPLKVSGTFAKPSYAVDVARAGKRAIKKELDRFIDKLLKRDADKKAPEDNSPEKKKPVEELLKGIFR